jgi:hypothetical protein
MLKNIQFNLKHRQTLWVSVNNVNSVTKNVRLNIYFYLERGHIYEKSCISQLHELSTKHVRDLYKKVQ